MQKLGGLQVHHIGFAVRSFEEVCPVFETLGANFFHSSEDVDRNLKFRFAKMGEIVLELDRLKSIGFKQMGKAITSKVYGYEATGVFLYSKEIGMIEVVMECGVDE